ncbi:MAG: type II CAAX endopeptidase family protein [Pseudomonadota bacterium]
MPTPFETYVRPARNTAQIWRTLVGVMAILMIYIALNAGALFYVALQAGPDVAESTVAKAGIGTTPGAAMTALATFIPLVIGIGLVTWALHRRAPMSLMGEGWEVEFVRAVGLIAVLAGLSYLLSPAGEPVEQNLPLSIWLTVLPLALLLVGIQTLSEELLFRGYLQQQLAARFATPVLWLLVPSILFGVAHTAPSVMGDAWLFPVIAATLFGLVAADLTARHGNLGAAWGIHLANNTAAILMVATEGQLSGLSLYVSPYSLEEVAANPALALPQAVPLILAWVILRRRSPV